MLRQPNTRSVPGVLFIEDFEEVVGRPPCVIPTVQPSGDEPLERLTPALTEDDVERRCAIAREDGFAAGYAVAEEQAASEHSLVCAKIRTELEQLRADACSQRSSDIEVVANAVFSVLAESLPTFCGRLGHEEVRAALRSVLSSVVHEPQLTIAVSAELEATVRDDLKVAGGPANRIDVTTCPDMLPGDLRVTWDHGSASRNTREIRRRLLDQLEVLGFLPTREEERL